MIVLSCKEHNKKVKEWLKNDLNVNKIDKLLLKFKWQFVIGAKKASSPKASFFLQG